MAYRWSTGRTCGLWLCSPASRLTRKEGISHVATARTGSREDAWFLLQPARRQHMPTSLFIMYMNYLQIPPRRLALGTAFTLLHFYMHAEVFIDRRESRETVS